MSKTIKHLIIFLISFVLLTTEVVSQDYRSQKRILQKKTMSAYRLNDYHSARDYCIKWLETDPGNEKALVLLAEFYYNTRDYINTINTIQKLSTETKKKNPQVLYYFAMSHKIAGKYQEAIIALKSLRKKHRKLNIRKISRNQVNTEIEGCYLALALKDTLTNIIIKPLQGDVNTGYIEFSPILINDSTLVYGSTDLDSITVVETNQYPISYRKFQLAKKNQEIWIKDSIPDAPYYNNSSFDTGRGTYSPDGKRFYFVRTELNKFGVPISHLWFTRQKQDLWLNPIKLEHKINSNRYNSSYPCIGTCYDKDLEVVYFSSDRSGSAGKMDIWYFIYNKKTNIYSPPQNAGVYINTEGNEMPCYYDLTSHQLYFASTGWPGLGGFDIFVSAGDLVNWQFPKNIGLPVNSSYDDLDYFVNDVGTHGLVVSNRPQNLNSNSTCCDDIFEFSKSQTERILVSGKLLKKDIFNNMSFKNQLNKIPQIELSGRSLSIYMVNDSSSLVYIKEAFTNDSGEFEFWAETDKVYEVQVNDSSVFNQKFHLSTIDYKPGSDMVLEPVLFKSAPVQPITVDNIYYQFNQTKLSEESKRAIDSTLLRLLMKHPEIIVEIRSHTDDIGDSKTNLNLSEKRAKNVLKYLVEKGINESRLRAKGFGESEPVAPNQLPDGKDNPEGRQKNRRTEFKIIGLDITHENDEN